MTGHDLDPIIGARQAAAAGCQEIAPIVMWAYLDGVVKEYDDLRAKLAAAERDRDEWKRSDHTMCDYAGGLLKRARSAEAALAAAEQERDKAQAQRERYYEAARQFGQAANRAEAALAAVRESATNLFNQIGFAGVQAIAEIAGRALAATEQDEPKRCAHGQSGPHHWNPEGTYSNGPGAGCPGPVEPKPCVHAVCSCTMGALPRCPEPTPEQP